VNSSQPFVWSGRVFFVLQALGILACSDLTNLQQENPGQILADDLYAPANAGLLVDGAIGDFECAFHRYVVAQGVLGDELQNAFANSTNMEYDRRTMPTSGAYGTATCSDVQFPGVYTPLSVARASLDAVVGRLEAWTDAEVSGRVGLLGQAAAYAGYSLLLLGEGMCSAAINLGPELTKAQLWQEAVARFDKAASAAAQASDGLTLGLSRLGQARTLLDLGNVAAAGASAALVPAGFSWGAGAAAGGEPRQQNIVYIHTNESFYSSVDPSFANLTFGGQPDPRVGVIITGQLGSDGQTPVRKQTKFVDRGASIPVARAQEARLIVAEANVAAGNLPGAVGIINALHTAAGILAYDGTGRTAAEVLAQVREERRRELFLEGHRLGDLQRYNVPLTPPAGTPYRTSGNYGAQRCFPLPDVERNNNPSL